MQQIAGRTLPSLLSFVDPAGAEAHGLVVCGRSPERGIFDRFRRPFSGLYVMTYAKSTCHSFDTPVQRSLLEFSRWGNGRGIRNSRIRTVRRHRDRVDPLPELLDVGRGKVDQCFSPVCNESSRISNDSQ